MIKTIVASVLVGTREYNGMGMRNRCFRRFSSVPAIFVCLMCSGCNFYTIDPKSCTMDPEHNPTAKPCEKRIESR